MKQTSLSLLLCPNCHGELILRNSPHDPVIHTGTLGCSSCHKAFPIRQGIPRFIIEGQLQGLNKPIARLYNWFSLIYPAFSKIGFLFLGTTESRARQQVIDRLEPRGKVLEVSIGPGVNLPYLFRTPAVSEVFGLDISIGQLKRCNTLLRRKRWPADLFHATAESLPFKDGSFDSVFHIGGINFFTDKQKAIAEMIRVARPGTKIIICDENEAGAQWYERFLPGFKSAFQGPRERVQAPIDLVPKAMQAIQLADIWNGFMYCLEFRKPE